MKMKRLLSGICILVLAGSAAAQSPALPAAPPVTYGQPIAQPPVGHSYGLPVQACQSGGCCAPVAKTCVAEPAMKTITHVSYGKACEEFCTPKCSCLSCFSNACGCTQCDCVRTKYYLIKKTCTQECPTTKCVVSTAPSCGSVISQPHIVPVAPQGTTMLPQSSGTVMQRTSTVPQGTLSIPQGTVAYPPQR
jgi:hypothetical protein